MRVFPPILGVLALAGCAPHVSLRSVATAPAPALAPAPAAAAPGARTPPPSGVPQLVIPVSGGPMLVALPLGGNVFLPVDGAAEVTGYRRVTLKSSACDQASRAAPAHARDQVHSSAFDHPQQEDQHYRADGRDDDGSDQPAAC